MHSLNMSKIIIWGLTVMWGYACIDLGRNVPEIKGHISPGQRIDNSIDRIGNIRTSVALISN